MLTRETSFTPGGLASAELELEFNNIVNYINNRTLSSPLSANLDFADLFTVVNLRTFWNVLNVAEYASLSAAEAALPSSGGILFVPPNTTIDIATTVTFTKDNTWIVGGGPSSILRRATGTFAATQNTMLLFNGRLNCGIKNLQLDGQQASNAASSGLSGVLVMGTSKNFRFGGNLVQRWGAVAEGSSNLNDGIRIGIDEASVPQGIWLSGNKFQDVRRSGVRLTNVQSGVVSDNEIIQDAVASVGAGVHMETPASGVGRLKGLSVRGNSILGLGSTLADRGIAFINGPSTASVSASRVAIIGNTIENTAAEGIYVEKGFLVGVEANELSLVLQSGTTLRGGVTLLNSTYSKVLGNGIMHVGDAIAASQASGVFVDASSGAVQGYNEVADNMIREIAYSGVYVIGASGITVPSIKIHDNTISRFGRESAGPALSPGIVVNPNTGTITSATIEGNTVTLDGTVPGSGNSSGIILLGGGVTFSRAIVIGNDLTDSDAGIGVPLDVSGAIGSLDVGHNQV